MTDNQQGAGGGARGTPLWIKILLGLSLAANLLIVGMFIGQKLKKERGGGIANRQVEWILRLVPEERRDFTKEHFSPIRDALRKARSDRAELMNAIVTAIRAEPFNAEALETALAARRDALNDRRVLVQDRLSGLLAEFDAEERSAFADKLEMYLERRRKRDGGARTE